MKDSPGALELLSERVDDLEKRIRALEHSADGRATAQISQPASAQRSDATSALETGKLFPIIGRAMLGIAGAYVLRAIAESGVFPKLPVSMFAVAYAFGWLVWSARISSGLARVVYAGTSALILAPMLWENTLAFHVFAPMASAGVLAAFLTLATVLDLRNGAVRGMWMAQSIAVLICAALAFRTHEVLPFVTAILLALCVTEFAQSRDYQEPVWPLIVLVADVSVWGLIFIYTGPQDTRVAYGQLSAAALIAPASILFAINGSAVAVRVMSRGFRIMVLETVQVVIAFALAVAALLYFAPVHGPMMLGIACLILSASAYVCAFRYLKARKERRSFRVFAIWSAALVLGGSLWALPLNGAAMLMAVAALAAIYLARRLEPTMLEFHGLVFLIGATVVSGLPGYLYDCVAGTPLHSPSAAISMISLCAVAALFVARSQTNGAWEGVLHLVLAFVAICASTALLVQGVLAGAGALMVLGAHHVAFLRTLTICVVALSIGFSGSHWERPRLTQLAYAALVLLGVKILFEDLRHGHMGFAAASIALFAVTLMGVPRLVRLGAQRRSGKPIKTENEESRQIPV